MKEKLQKKFLSSQEHEEDQNYNDFDNRTRLMKFNRAVANHKTVTIVYWCIALALFFLSIFGLTWLRAANFSALLSGGEIDYDAPNYISTVVELKWVFIALVILAIVGWFKVLYNVSVSWGDIANGQEGTARWSSRKEIEETYKCIPDAERYEMITDSNGKTVAKIGEDGLPIIKDASVFSGGGGIPVARDGDKLFIDDSAVNNLIIGTSRSGKGEMIVFPAIDIYSRAKKQASLVINDPKLELAPATIPILQRRGYDCFVLNLIDPEFSCFYNPLPVITTEMKLGNIPATQQLIRSLAYNVIAADPNEKDPYWSDQARNVFISSVYAHISDNLEADIKLNKRLKYRHEVFERKARLDAINELEEEDRILYKILDFAEDILSKNPEATVLDIYTRICHSDIDSTTKAYVKAFSEKDEEFERILQKPKPIINYKYTEFVPSTENEDKINLYSVVTMVNTLFSTKSGEKTALDDYFNHRDETDFARQTFASVGSASENTKGTVMSSFQQKTSIFVYENIGKMMSKNSFNMLDVGFGKKPIAVFLGLPDYDSSNHFLATVFINQLYFTLAKMATAMPGNKTHREVVFLLDEFGNMPPLDNMESLVSVCLGRGIRFYFIIQALSQLVDKYGEETAKTIRGNCGNWVYILTTENETASEISQALGNETTISINRTGKKLSLNKELSESAKQRPLLDATELTHLEAGEMIVLRFLKRNTLDGKNIKANPIKNLGKNRMLYRYQYLINSFPSGTILYRSNNLDRIIANNPEIEIRSEDMKIAKVEINNTQGIDLKKVSQSADKYLKDANREQKKIADLYSEDPKKVLQMFDLVDYDEEKRQMVLNNEPNYDFDVYDFTKYAESLIKLESFKMQGYNLLDLLWPINYQEIDTLNKSNNLKDLSYSFLNE